MASPVEPDDSSVVDPVPAESTVPEDAPARRPTPIIVPARGRVDRQRRSTVVSPIPALLAASMRPDGKPPGRRSRSSVPEGIPIVAGPAQTSRISDQDQADLLGDDEDGDGEPDYVVEIEQSKPDPT
jgi:hypothetical protein